MNKTATAHSDKITMVGFGEQFKTSPLHGKKSGVLCSFSLKKFSRKQHFSFFTKQKSLYKTTLGNFV